MAKLPQLVRALAGVDGRKVGTIEHISRVLREEGLLVSGKRGIGAPEMNFTDAANLLIAINASDNLVDAPDATRLMLGLNSVGDVNEERTHLLPEIENQRSFGDALVYVIMKAPHIVHLLYSLLDQRYCDPYSDEERERLKRQIHLGFGPIIFKVIFSRTFASLAIETVDSTPSIQWQRDYYVSPQATSSLPKALQGDRRVSVEVGLPTIIALHECISGEPLESGYDERGIREGD